MKDFIEKVKKKWVLLAQIVGFPIVGLVAVVVYWRGVNFFFKFIIPCEVTQYTNRVYERCDGANFLAMIATIITGFSIMFFIYLIIEQD